MRNLLAVLVVLISSVNICVANEAKKQANAFAKIYSSLCLKNLSNLEDLRRQLKSVPKLPEKKAEHFLSGYKGDAWPIPNKFGLFVLALPYNNNICLVYARRADTKKSEEIFKKLVSTAPKPITSRLVGTTNKQTTANGSTRTISYEWSTSGVVRKRLFTLTTANSGNAQIQVLGSAALVK